MNTSQNEIITIATDYINNVDNYEYIFIRLYGGLPSEFNPYNIPRDIDCWVVQFLRNEIGLFSSTLVAVNKADGKVIWYGSAGDEG